MAISSGNGTGARRSSGDAVGTILLATWAIETWAFASAILHILNCSRWHSWKSRAAEGFDVPVLRLAWALLWWVVCLVTTIATWIRSAGKCLLQIIELLRDRLYFVAFDVNDTVSVALLAVLVDQTTRDSLGHVFLVKSFGLLECPGIGNAAVLREATTRLAKTFARYMEVRHDLQERNAVVAVLLDQDIPAGFGERGRITPLVVVDREEVASGWCWSAVHVLALLILVRDIGC